MRRRKESRASGISLVAAAVLAVWPSAARAAWQNDAPLPAAYVLTKTVAGNGVLYKIGGLGEKGICGTPDVFYSRTGPDGSATAWTATTPLPPAGISTVTFTCAGVDYQLSDIVIGWGYEAVYSNGFVYLLGGNLWNFNGFSDGSRIHFSSAVYYAQANADGSLGAWRRGPDLPYASFDAAAAVSNGVIYLTGGRDDAGTPNVRRDTFYSRLNADGSPGAWRTSSYLMPGGLWLHGAAVAQDRLYVSGGVTYDPFPRDDITDAVFSCPLTADGTPGEWRPEASLPTGLAGHAMKTRHGILYTMGGQEPDLPTANVHESPVNPDGSLTPWGFADALPVTLYMQGSAVGGDALYVDGGSDGNTPMNAVYRLPDTVAPASVADLSAVALDSSSLRVSWSAPGNDGPYGSVAGGRYDLRASSDPAAVEATAPVSWTASFDPGQAQARILTGLSGGVTYYLSLRAADASGNLSPPSNPASATTLAPPPPNPVPALASLVPASAVAGGGAFTLTLNGSGFVAGAVVRWNGEDRPTTMVDASRLTASVSAVDIAVAGSAGVSVFNPAPGGGSSFPLPFTVGNPVPAVASLSPAEATAGGPAFSLAVNGSGFVSGSVVRWNGADRPTVFAGPTLLTASVSSGDAAAAGEDSVTVFNPAPAGGESSPASFTVGNPVPVLTALNPSAAVAGGSGLALTVTGANFAQGASVLWNGSPRPTAFVSPSQLTVTIGAGDLAAAGAAVVAAVNPAPGGGTSAPAPFTIENPAPVLASVDPAAVDAGGAAFALTVTGSGFSPSSVVRWNGTDRSTVFVGATRLSAAIGAADIATVGAASISVFTPAPGGGASAAVPFAVNEPPAAAPLLASVSPDAALVGASGLTLTVNGSSLTPATVVQWNGAARPTLFVSTTQLTAAVSAADLSSAGNAVVTLFTPAPGGGTSGPASFTIANPAPLLASVSPDAADAGAPGFTLTVNGEGFVSGSSVRWNGADRPSSFVSASRLTASISAADVSAAGTAAVAVFTPGPGGGTTASAVFTVSPPPNPLPAVSSLSPDAATAGGPALTLAVLGAGFVTGSVVRWNGADRPTTFLDATRLTAAVSASDLASAGAASVSVFSPAPGGGTSGAAAFTVANPLPTLASLSPNAGSAGGAAFTLTVDGAGFVPGSSVLWNGAARATAFASASQLTAAISAADIASAGSAAVTVFSPAPGGGTSVPATFTIDAPAPPPAPAFVVAFTPRTLNLKSNGSFVKAVIESSDGGDAGRIDPASLALTEVDGEAVAPVSAAAIRAGDADSDGIGDVELSFGRAAVEALLSAGTRTLTVSGKLKDGAAFSLRGSLDAIAPGNSGHGAASAAARSGLAVSGPRFWPAPKPILALKTMAWDDPEPFSPDKTPRRVAEGRVALRIPDGAASPAVTLTISTTAAETQPDAAPRRWKTEEVGLVPVAVPIVFGPEGTRFQHPVTLELPYDRSALPPGVEESSLSVHYWNPATEDWEKLPSIVDRQAQVVRAQTRHFSLYQVLSDPAAASPAAATSAVDQVKVWPNPFRPAQGHAKVNFDQLPAGARVRVYALTGALVRDLTADGAGHAEWNGSNRDGSSAASGIYFVLLEGTGGRKIVKVAVQR